MPSSAWDDGLNVTDPRQEDTGLRPLDYMIHEVFYQNELGAKLLERWTEALIMTPTATRGLDQVSIGINEGTKEFIRNIILTVKRVNEDE